MKLKIFQKTKIKFKKKKKLKYLKYMCAIFLTVDDRKCIIKPYLHNKDLIM